jgi:hypothetical protein
VVQIRYVYGINSSGRYCTLLRDKNVLNATETELLESIKKRLEVIIALSLREQASQDKRFSLKEQIELLDGFGLRPKDIADILGKTSGHVSKELVGIRRTKKK